MEELSLFSYTWVPVNALMAVERDVLHISTPSIFEELQKKLEGMVYIHAKNCLTKLARKVAKVDNIKLKKLSWISSLKIPSQDFSISLNLYGL